MDWNKDGKQDLIAGDSAGEVRIFLNEGTAKAPILAEGIRVKADGKEIFGGDRDKIYPRGRLKSFVDTASHKLATVYTKIHFADWNDDGLEDLLVGHETEVILYKNAGKPGAPILLAPVKIVIPEGKFPARPSPFIVDWDGDGKKDLLTGGFSAEIVFYRNVGTSKKPLLERGKYLKLKGEGFEKSIRCRIDVTDWNNDGKLDILVGNFNGVIVDGKAKLDGNIWLFLGK